MATAYSIDKYRDPEKIDLSSTFQAQAYKQQNYDINTTQTQQLINQYAGTDLLRDVDKQYFGERLNTLVGFINQSGTRDWSRKSISNELQNYVSTALDKNVMSAIASTHSFRKQQAEIEDFKKNKPDQYSMQNEWFATQDLQRYLKSTEIGDSYRAQSYVPYTDVKKTILDNADKLKDFGVEYYVEPIGGNAYFRQLGTFEKIDPEKAKQFLSTIMDAKTMNQLYIDGQYSYKDTDAATVKEKYIDKLESYNKVYDDRLTELKTLMAGATRDKKPQYEQAIVTLENSKNELNKSKTKNISKEAMADYLYRSDFENKWTGFLSYNRLKDYKIDDSGFKIQAHIDDVKMANRNYNLQVDKFKYDMMNDSANRAQQDAHFEAKMKVDGYQKNEDGTYSFVGGPSSGITATDQVTTLEEEERPTPILEAQNQWQNSVTQIKDTVAKELEAAVKLPENKFYGDKLQNANFEHVAYLLVNRPDQYTGLYNLLSKDAKLIVDRAKSNKLRLNEGIDKNLNAIKTDMIAVGKAAMSPKTKDNTKQMFRSNSYGYTLDSNGNLVTGDVLQGDHKFANVARVITQVNSLLKDENLSEDDKAGYNRLLINTMTENGMSNKQMKAVIDKMVFQKTYNGILDAAGQLGANILLTGPAGSINRKVLKGYQGIANAFESSGDKFTFADDAIKYADAAEWSRNERGFKGNKRGIVGEIVDTVDGFSLLKRNENLNSLGGNNAFSDEDIDSSKLIDTNGKSFKPSSLIERWNTQLSSSRESLMKSATLDINRAFNIDMGSKAGQAMRGNIMALLPVGSDLQKDSNLQVTIDKKTGMANITAAIKQDKEYVPTTFQAKLTDLPPMLLNQIDFSERNEIYSASNPYAVNYSKTTEIPRTIDEWSEKLNSLPFSERTQAFKNPPKTQEDILRTLDSAYGKEIVDKNIANIEKIIDAPYKIQNIRENGQWTVEVSKPDNTPIYRQETGLEVYEPNLMEKASNKILTEAIETRLKELLHNGRTR